MKIRQIAMPSVLAWWFLTSLAPTEVKAEPPIVAKICIEGNQRVEKDAILFHVTQETDEPLDDDAVKSDIRSIWEMGFFDAVRAEVESIKDEPLLVYTVHERPQVIEVRIVGMEALSRTDPRVVQAIKVHDGYILDPDAVRDTIENLISVYNDEGYIDAQVTFTAIPGASNTAVAEFKVTEIPQ